MSPTPLFFTPGPIVPEAMPLGPRVSRPFAFEGLAAELAVVVAGVDSALSTRVQTIAPMLARNLEPAFQTDVAPATGGLTALGLARDDAEFAAIAGAVDAVLAAVGAQQLDLPGPDEEDPGVPANPAPPPGDPDKE